MTVELHGFCDASQNAYAAVIYIRATYASNPPSCKLVISKTRVAPLKPTTIPRLELCGAALLARTMKATRETLGIPVEQVYAWSDSTIVLAWLDGSPQRYRVYVANRIVTVTDIIPPVAWKHVPTLDNPADCASRGVTPKLLQVHELWWQGPSWLMQQPICVPPQPNAVDISDLEENEVKPHISHITSAVPAE